jgi:hypothetical protein
MNCRIVIDYEIVDDDKLPHSELYDLQSDIEDGIFKQYKDGFTAGSWLAMVEYMASPVRLVQQECEVIWSVKTEYEKEEDNE